MTIRPATHDDIHDILCLVSDHARRGDVLPRTALSIRDTLDDWLVGVHEDGGIVACVNLLYYTPFLAEVRSLAVHDRVKGNGWGSRLVQALIAEAERRQVPMLFALTRAVRFFEKLGFAVTDIAQFPQKVRRDCDFCPIQDHCDETAVILNTYPQIEIEPMPISLNEMVKTDTPPEG